MKALRKKRINTMLHCLLFIGFPPLGQDQNLPLIDDIGGLQLIEPSQSLHRSSIPFRDLAKGLTRFHEMAPHCGRRTCGDRRIGGRNSGRESDRRRGSLGRCESRLRCPGREGKGLPIPKRSPQRTKYQVVGEEKNDHYAPFPASQESPFPQKTTQLLPLQNRP